MKKSILLLGLLFLALASTAQTVTIPGVKGRFYNGVHSIEDKGFYTIYLGEKLKKGMREYVLEIYDLDLNSINKTKVVVNKADVLVGSEFNGKFFFFAFNNYSKKTNSYFIFDAQGKEVKKETIPVKRLASVGSAGIYPARDGSGFYITSIVKEKKWGYRIRKMDNNAQVKWDKTFTRPKGLASIATAESSNGRLTIITNERPSLMAYRKAMRFMISIDDNTGDELYKIPLFDGTTTAIPSSLFVEADGTTVSCGMYYNGEKVKEKNSDGIFFLKLAPDGTEVARNYIDWDNGIQEALAATSRKFSIGSKPKVLFHEIIPEPGGGYQVISETFRKTVKAGTVMAMMANNNEPPPMGFTVMDYIIFNYDNMGNPVDINKIEKPYKSIMVDGRVAQMGGVALAARLKQMRVFTYEFSTTLEGSDQRVIVFTNFEEAGLGKGKPYIGISTITPGEESKTRKIPVSKKHTAKATGAKDLKSGCLKARPGKMCTYLYDRKDKVISIAIEDLSID